MVLTPLLVFIAQKLSQAFPASQQDLLIPEHHDGALRDHVIIAGYGRVGQTVATILKQQSVDFIALDLNADSVRQSRESGQPVYYGDAARSNALKLAGAEQAKVMLVTLDEPIAALRIVQAVKQLWPTLTVLVRAQNAAHSNELYEQGADAVMPETIEASLQLAAMVLEKADIEAETITACLDTIRANGYQAIKST